MLSSLLIIGILLFLVLLLCYLIRQERLEFNRAQIRHLEYLREKDDDIRALIECALFSEGKQIKFPKRASVQSIEDIKPGWMGQKSVDQIRLTELPR